MSTDDSNNNTDVKYNNNLKKMAKKFDVEENAHFEPTNQNSLILPEEVSKTI